MKYCTKCKVKVNTVAQKCPLCSVILTEGSNTMEEVSENKAVNTRGKAEENPADINRTPITGDTAKYPVPDKEAIHRYNFVFRLFLFLSVVVCSSCLLINFFIYTDTMWSLYVIGSILYIWITVGYPLYAKRKIGHIIVINTIATSIYVYSLELATRTKGWGLTYVTPFLFISATLMITFITLLKRLKWREYAVYQTIMVILGFLPILFCVTGLVTSIWPSVLSAFYSFITLMGMFIFADKKYKNELIKRFHL